MSPESIRSLILGGELSPPYEIHTTGGKSYRIESDANVFAPEAFPDLLVVAVPHRGIALVGFNSIASIDAEHEAAGPTAARS